MMRSKQKLTFTSLAVSLGVILAMVLMCRISPTHAMTLSNPVDDVTVYTPTVGSGLHLVMPGSGHALYVLTLTQDATMNLDTGKWAGQNLTVFVCEDATGGWTPGFNPTAGVTVYKNTPLPLNKAANKCNMIGFMYTTPTTVGQTGYDALP